MQSSNFLIFFYFCQTEVTPSGQSFLFVPSHVVGAISIDKDIARIQNHPLEVEIAVILGNPIKLNHAIQGLVQVRKLIFPKMELILKAQILGTFASMYKFFFFTKVFFNSTSVILHHTLQGNIYPNHFKINVTLLSYGLHH